jgi:hypothetical protein
MIDRSDPQGRTYREINLAKTHAFPIGSLAEVVNHDDPEEVCGQRLFVVSHDRDCDGSPLYSLAFDPSDTVRRRFGFANPRWHPGFPEHMLKLVRLPAQLPGALTPPLQ